MSKKSKQCRRCAETKALTEFNRAPTVFGGDGYTKDCKDCRALIRQERKAAAEGGGSEQQQEVEETRPHLSVPWTLGFRVVVEGVEFHITQTNGDTESTVILAAHELRALWEFAQAQVSSSLPAAAA